MRMSWSYDKDSNHYSMIEDEKLFPRAGIEPRIIPSWEKITKHLKTTIGKLSIFSFNYISEN